MTDPTPWQSPAGSDPMDAGPSVFPPPATGPYAASAPGMAPGWTPPPKPGLIPLRPLTLGTVLSASFQVLRRNPRPTFGFSLLVTGVVLLVGLGTLGFVLVWASSRIANADQADAQTLTAGSVAIGLLGVLLLGALSLVGSALLQGVISLEVARGTVGEKLRLAGLVRAARGRIGVLIGWSAALSGVILLVILVLFGVTLLFATIGGVAGAVVGILFGLVAFAGALVLAAWVGTRVSLVPSVLMLERLPLRGAIVRSWSLTRGYFWRTFGILLLVLVIVQIVSSIISTPINILASFGSTLINPNGDDQALIVGFIVVSTLTVIVTLLFSAIAAVIQSATPALLYIDLRMRKEGLDLELARFVEARQVGDASVPDPYLPRTVQTWASPQPGPGVFSGPE